MSACKRGHEMTPANTYIRRGASECRACQALRKREKRQQDQVVHLHQLSPEAARSIAGAFCQLCETIS